MCQRPAHSLPPVSYFLLSLILVLLSPAAVAQPSPRPVKTICNVPIPDLLAPVLHARFSADYLRPKFPNIDWRYKFTSRPLSINVPVEQTNATDNSTSTVLEVRQSVTPRSAVLGWIENGTDCDVMIGPGFSFVSIALSPLVLVPWVCFFATSTALSDKAHHPTFSRVIPTDDAGARIIVAAMDHFQWRRIAILCSDEPYGQSVASGVSEALTSGGGTNSSSSRLPGFIEASTCVEPSASRERVDLALRSVHDASTRIVFVGMLPGTAAFRHLVDIVTSTRMHEDTIFIFSEAMCSTNDRTYLAVPGGMCATYTTDVNRTATIAEYI